MRAHIQIGRELRDKKRTLKGGWLAWLKDNEATLGFGARTARRLVAAAEWTLASTIDGQRAQLRELWGHADNKPYDRHGNPNDECYSPPILLNAARRVLGTIDLDPASCAAAQKTVKAGLYYDKQTDGLQHEWRGKMIFLNPPFSTKLIRPFTEKFLTEWKAGRITAAIIVCLNTTDTKWAQPLLTESDVVCFWKGRIPFETEGHCQWGHMVCYFGPEKRRFAECFKEFGAVR
jgi:DNA N-6-adenine-methyltransferase (Dam)